MGYGKGLGPLRTLQGEAGFTLVELLLALFLFALIAGVVFAAFAAVVSGVEKGLAEYRDLSRWTCGLAAHGAGSRCGHAAASRERHALPGQKKCGRWDRA